MADRGSNVTQWNMAQLLIETVPEASLIMAKRTARAINIEKRLRDLPNPVSEDPPSADPEKDNHPYYDALSRVVGESVLANFGPYGIAGEIFRPIFEEALGRESIDVDLVRRCCEFLENALAGEEIVAESIEMMISENIGYEFALRVRPYAGVRFLGSLRGFNWIN